MTKVLYTLAGLGALGGATLLAEIVLGTIKGLSAIQETSIIALAVALAVIPYVLARAYQEITRS